ncbi:MAG: hypothetical protein MAG451_00373 [Anaerolineales bacterium]|nr:hypothetical protein [Anaerolineales bacterium]
MNEYVLPREVFALLEEALGERQKAETFARAIEAAVGAIEIRADESITARKEHLKIELKEELRNELVTRELFEQETTRIEQEFALTREMFEREILLTRELFDQRFNVIEERFKTVDERFKTVDERFNSLNFKLNIFIAIALLALTLANPTFVALIERLFKFLVP